MNASYKEVNAVCSQEISRKELTVPKEKIPVSQPCRYLISERVKQSNLQFPIMSEQIHPLNDSRRLKIILKEPPGCPGRFLHVTD
jgi:hypothetical protein